MSEDILVCDVCGRDHDPDGILTQVEVCRSCEAGDHYMIEVLSERVDVLRKLLQRAVSLAAYAQDVPQREEEAKQWHHDVAVALDRCPDSATNKENG